MHNCFYLLSFPSNGTSSGLVHVFPSARYNGWDRSGWRADPFVRKCSFALQGKERKSLVNLSQIGVIEYKQIAISLFLP
jgi:hypothetical protein